MIPGCTHALDIEFDDHTVDLATAVNVFVSVRQGSLQIDLSTERVEVDETGYKLTVYLTQEETLRFKSGTASLQVNWTFRDGLQNLCRDASDVATVTWGEQLLRRVL